MEQATAQAAGTVVERFTLKALVEACLVLEEGVASLKDIEIGMMTGAGILPGPFARADERGLDDTLQALERAESEWGEHFAPPTILRRLVAQGRLVARPISVIESEDVLLERIACPGVVASSSANTFFLISIRSGTASIAKSTSPNRS